MREIPGNTRKPISTSRVRMFYTCGVSALIDFSNPNQKRKRQNSIKWSLIELKFCTHLLEDVLTTKFHLKRIKAWTAVQKIRSKIGVFVVFLKRGDGVLVGNLIEGKPIHACSQDLVAPNKCPRPIPKTQFKEFSRKHWKGRYLEDFGAWNHEVWS